jgi:NTP pyrophosphatase (non-canonical NTP hydrolase)
VLVEANFASKEKKMLLRDYAAAIAPLQLKDGLEIPVEVTCLGLVEEFEEFVEEWHAYSRAAQAGDRAEADRRMTLAKQEAGDVLWYIVTLAANLHVDINVIDLVGAPTKNMTSITGRIAGRVKKAAWHGKPYTGFAAQLDMCTLLSSFREYCTRYLNTSLEDISDINLKKLEKRYPGLVFVEGGGVRS